MIHGSGGDHRVWALQSARLAGAVALDLPGHPDGTPATDLEGLVDACTPAIAALESSRLLVGHSLGGAVALELARRSPSLVDGLVVVASGARLPVPDATMTRVHEDFAAERERLMAGFFADRGASMAGEVERALESCGRETLASDYEVCRDVDLRGLLGGLRVPALVVVGSDDPFTPPWMSEELCRELPMSRMVVIPGGRHMAMAEFGMTVTHLIAAFLARLELTLRGA
jgi:pimeloyl-ACP methyl ester carboxylesterase